MSSILLALAPSVPVVMLARLLAGAGQQSCGVGRQAFCAAAVATHHRGRVVGLLGGVSRIGGIAGPLIGGFMAQRYGFRAAFMLQVRSSTPTHSSASDRCRPTAQPADYTALRQCHLRLRTLKERYATAD